MDNTFENNLANNSIQKIDNQNIYFGIPNIQKRNEEAIFDALSYFKKKCPYCGADLYQTGIRDKIEIDHFVPIAKGGQDYPWNLFPICKACNRKKRAKFPDEYLDSRRYKICLDYLEKVKNDFTNNGIAALVDIEKIKVLIDQNLSFIGLHKNNRFIKNILYIMNREDLVFVNEISELKYSDNISVVKEFLQIFDLNINKNILYYNRHTSEFYISINSAYEYYSKMNINTVIPRITIRHIFRDLIIPNEKTIKRINDKTCRVIRYELSHVNPEYAKVITEIFEEKKDF